MPPLEELLVIVFYTQALDKEGAGASFRHLNPGAHGIFRGTQMLVSFPFIWVFLNPTLSVLTEVTQGRFGKKTA